MNTIYNLNNLKVEKVFSGFFSNSFKVINDNGLSCEEIADILNNIIYGLDNKLIYKVKKSFGKVYIQIFEDVVLNTLMI